MQKKTENFPELIIGLVGPIGVNLVYVQEKIVEVLKILKYEPVTIHLTEKMRAVNTGIDIDKNDYEKKYLSLIKYADTVCQLADSKAAMAALAIAAVRSKRKEITGDEDKPALRHAYIIRQFKRPQEVELMRTTYGRKFIQISVYAPEKQRRKDLMNYIMQFNEMPITKETAEKSAINLIKIDHDEDDGEFGQRISKVFHLGDVFVDGSSEQGINTTVERFFFALFGHNGISPNKIEYGLYMAAAAALRSIDLSRQVGAAIFSPDGEIISMGCNEVPKAFGGTYWTEDPNTASRDFEVGRDANYQHKIKVLYDLVERMGKAGFFCEEIKSKGDYISQLRFILNDESIKESKFMDIIEYGRIIHAEMSAITDAARLGRSVKNSIMYCTTFPCHLCAKHIVSSGIKYVYFLEPYPKSYASDLHSDSISFDAVEQESKVVFLPFIGISPRRYRDLFEKKGRKYDDGKRKIWYHDEPTPMIEDLSTSYIENEDSSIILAIPSRDNIKT